jgi:CTP synthase
VRIGIVGKYTDLKESYKSLHEALVHAAAEQNVCVDLKYIDAEALEGAEYRELDARRPLFEDCHGILVPGGFGRRGVEGKIRAIELARTRRIPFFGICLGMQLMAIEFARNVIGLKRAHSGEFERRGDLVIDFMQGQRNSAKGGTMRLGAYDCKLQLRTHAAKAYGRLKVSERHRHRLEFQNRYRRRFEAKGLVVSGTNPQSGLVEILELKGHPGFLGCQFHPEFKSRPVEAHPLFRAFIQASRFVIPMDFD